MAQVKLSRDYLTIHSGQLRSVQDDAFALLAEVTRGQLRMAQVKTSRDHLIIHSVQLRSVQDDASALVISGHQRSAQIGTGQDKQRSSHNSLYFWSVQYEASSSCMSDDITSVQIISAQISSGRLRSAQVGSGKLRAD